mmetsp:Transcript_18662/g.27442  ORF Transcript_18662/g.27442 Transcript_18662/m.27442 type:complete len:150 (+) Transcript_18662:304-753(+)
MGTAPEIWNVIMGVMVKVIPRTFWLNPTFSQGLATFSEPMVKLTDKFVGETHAIRVDVRGESGAEAKALQTHRSFRECVGQSCAEFVLMLLKRHASDNDTMSTGVYLPEQLFREDAKRKEMLARLTSTPGTTGYTIQDNAQIKTSLFES